MEVDVWTTGGGFQQHLLEHQRLHFVLTKQPSNASGKSAPRHKVLWTECLFQSNWRLLLNWDRSLVDWMWSECLFHSNWRLLLNWDSGCRQCIVNLLCQFEHVKIVIGSIYRC
jgi:hypothetical protein